MAATPGKPGNGSCAGPIRVLVVDDEPWLRKLLVVILSEAGMTPREAADEPSALAMLAEEPFDVVLSDVGLGAGSGVDLVREMRARGLETRAILVTGDPGQLGGLRRELLGVREVLVKPVPAGDLVTAVERAAGPDPRALR